MAPTSRPTRSSLSTPSRLASLCSLFSVPTLAATAMLIGNATPADAAKISLAATGSSVSQTGVLVGGGGGGATPPSLTAPANVRMNSRKLCTASPAQSPCTVSDGTSVAQISWYDVSTDDVRTHVERRMEPNGAWARVQTIPNPVTYAASTYDRGLLPDTRYCYRLTAEAADGRAQTSGQTCVVTQKPGDLPVTRAQLRLVVANVPNGGTDGRFAVSLNLNADYDGGELMFPEYGAARFRPPTGGACVFSCSLLHEAAPVTRGERFVYVPFLYDEEAAAIRLQNERFLAASKG